MTQPGGDPNRSLPFLADGGEVGRLMRAHDWSSSPLGPPEHWPQTLRIAVSIMLSSKFPMFVAWGSELGFLYNDGYAEILAEKHPRAIGCRFEDIWSDIWTTIQPIAESAMAGEASYYENLPLTMRRKGYDEQTWFTFSYSPLKEEDGKVGGMFCAVTETTEAVLAQRMQTDQLAILEESEERFRTIADLAPVPMWVTRLDRKRSFVNQAYVDFLGTSREEAAEWDWRQNIHPDDHDHIMTGSIEGEASLQPFVLEGRYLRGDGKWRWLRSISRPRLGPDGELQGFIGVATDITASKEAEAALRELNETLERRVQERTADLSEALATLTTEINERQRAEEALRQAQKMEAVGQLTGGIAHDFNNLLTPIVGGLELIAGRLDDPRLKRIADNALESARRGAKLTSQLLTFSRIQRISMSAVDVNDVIQGMQDFIQHTIGRTVRVTTELSPDAGMAICDGNQLENAVLNLAINARDAMPGGGELTIRTARRTMDDQADLSAGDFVCVTVEDSGEGMDSDVLARATEPFFSTKPLGKGTGLGLAQVYGIARQSGGALRIESEPGSGTAVHIFLPCVDSSEDEEDSPQQNDAAQPSSAGQSARVLVIDDDPEVRAFLTDALEGLGHACIEAQDAEAGLVHIEASRPDLMLVDFAMPGVNGAELAATVNERWPGIPIVFVTGYAESDQLEAALGGQAPLLRKPFTLADLANVVNGNLKRGVG